MELKLGRDCLLDHISELVCTNSSQPIVGHRGGLLVLLIDDHWHDHWLLLRLLDLGKHIMLSNWLCNVSVRLFWARHALFRLLNCDFSNRPALWQAHVPSIELLLVSSELVENAVDFLGDYLFCNLFHLGRIKRLRTGQVPRLRSLHVVLSNGSDHSRLVEALRLAGLEALDALPHERVKLLMV